MFPVRGHPAVTLPGHKPLRDENRAGIIMPKVVLKGGGRADGHGPHGPSVCRAENHVVSIAVPSHCPGHQQCRAQSCGEGHWLRNVLA